MNVFFSERNICLGIRFLRGRRRRSQTLVPPNLIQTLSTTALNLHPRYVFLHRLDLHLIFLCASFCTREFSLTKSLTATYWYLMLSMRIKWWMVSIESTLTKKVSTNFSMFCMVWRYSTWECQEWFLCTFRFICFEAGIDSDPFNALLLSTVILKYFSIASPHFYVLLL